MSFKKLIWFALILLGVYSFTSKPVDHIVFEDNCETINSSFIGGEEFVFTVYYNWKFIWIPAGEAHFKVTETDEDYIVTVRGGTYESYDYFFKVKDSFYSRIDKKTLLPKNFSRTVEEGDYRLFDSISFNQDLGTAISVHGKTRETATESVFEFSECRHDLLSVLYFLRNVNVDGYNKGEFIPTKIFFDQETFPIKVRYMGKKKKKKIKNMGKFNTIRVIPDLVVGNIFSEGDQMNIWVTDDQNKLPLLIESPMKIGSGKAILKSYKGTRYPIIARR